MVPFWFKKKNIKVAVDPNLIGSFFSVDQASSCMSHETTWYPNPAAGKLLWSMDDSLACQQNISPVMRVAIFQASTASFFRK